MYGLPQAGRLSQLRLISHLAAHGYHQCPNTPCLFQHEHDTLDVTFSLVVDDFGIRYGSQSDADHLIATIRANDYDLTIKPTGDTYLGMNISFTSNSVSLSMPGRLYPQGPTTLPSTVPPTHPPRRSHTRKISRGHLPSYPNCYRRQVPSHHSNTTHRNSSHRRHFALLRPCRRPVPTTDRKRNRVVASQPNPESPYRRQPRPKLCLQTPEQLYNILCLRHDSLSSLR
jgi:hypothetical protein